jgi:hypothetical protein
MGDQEKMLPEFLSQEPEAPSEVSKELAEKIEAFDRVNDLRKRLFVLIKEKYPAKEMEVWNKFVGEANRLKVRYGEEYDKYLLFHAFSGSTPDFGFHILIDFPGDDSVEKFILDKAEELGITKDELTKIKE